MTIQQLNINGFKSIHAETIELGRVNCFIGANGVGKSNVLEAIGVLGAAANGVVDDEALLRRGVRAGLPRLFKSSFASERTPAHIGVGVASAQGAAYRVSLLNPLESPEPAWTYKTEVLTDGSEEIVSDGVRNKKNLNPQAGLAALRLVDVEPTNPAAQLMQALQQYAIYCPNTPTLRGTVLDFLRFAGVVNLGTVRTAEKFRRWLPTFGRSHWCQMPACGLPSRPHRAVFAPHG